MLWFLLPPLLSKTHQAANKCPQWWLVVVCLLTLFIPVGVSSLLLASTSA